MQKNKIVNFITKYHLQGQCQQVKIKVKPDKLVTSFATEQKDLLGFVAVSDLEFPSLPEDVISGNEMEIGVFNTSALSKILSVMGNQVDISFKSEMGKVYQMSMDDGTFQSNIMLADLDIIEEPPKLNDLPDFEIEFNFLGNAFSENFIKATNALPDSNTVTFIDSGDGVDVVLNHADHNTDNIKISLIPDAKEGSFENMRFNSDLLRDVLVANKDATSMKFFLSTKGLLKMQFQGDGFATVYYLVMLQS